MNGGRVARGVHPLGIRKMSKQTANQPTEKRETSYRIHVLPALYRCVWKQLMFRRVRKTAKGDC